MERIPADELTDEQWEKRFFVRDGLEDVLVRATGGFVRQAEYAAFACGHEAVALTVGREPGEVRDIPVNVTGDSLLAIAKDIMKAVEKVYG